MNNSLTCCGKDLIMQSDYTEVDLYLEEDKTTCLWVYTKENNFFVIKDVNGNPVRYNGWWSIPFIQYNSYATAMVEDSKVMYFTMIDKREVNG